MSVETNKAKNKNSNSFTCKCIFGLGITSVAGFVELMSKYKAVKELGIFYANANTVTYNKKAGLVVFDGVREVFRFHKMIRSTQVLVISEIPTVLKELSDVVPLDFDQQRSYEFNFKQVNPQEVLKAMKSKTLTMESKFVGYNNLGYHVERVKSTGDFIASYLALTSSLPFDRRTAVRKTMLKFFQSKKPKADIVTNGITDICKDFNLKNEITTFNSLFKKQADAYYAAVNNIGPITTIAKQLNVDQYAVSYLRKMVRSFNIVSERNSKSNVFIAA